MANSRSSSESSMSDYDLSKFNQTHRRLKQFLWLIPLLAVILFILAFVIGYAYLTSNELMEPVFPYPSDIGSVPPYSSYFGQFLDVIAILLLITAYCRYKQISLYLVGGLEKETNNNKHAKKILVKLQKLNFSALFLKYVWAFFIFVYTNFRSSEHFYIHLIAVIVSSILTLVYMFIMCHLSRKLYEYGEIESKPITMFISAIIYTIGALLTLIIGIVSASQLKSYEDFMNHRQRIFWRSNIEGYDLHIASTIINWITLLMIVPFYCSISRRMRLFRGWGQIMF